MDRQWRICGLGDYANYYSYFTYGVMEGSILNGAWFRPIPLFGQPLQAVREQILFFKPHAVLAHMIFNKQGQHSMEDVFTLLSDLRRKGIRVIYHAGDAREVPRWPYDISGIVDFALANHGLRKEYSKAWNVPCYHWPYACLQQNGILERKHVSEEYRSLVTFTGSLTASVNHVHAERTRFVEALQKRISIKCFPTPETGNTRFQTAEVAAGAEAVLGVGMAEHIPEYIDVRPFQYIGAGAAYFHNHSYVMSKFFLDGFHFIGYEKNNVEDFLYKFHNEEHRAKVRVQGFKFAQRYHSTKARMRMVLDLLEGKTPQPIYIDQVEA